MITLILNYQLSTRSKEMRKIVEAQEVLNDVIAVNYGAIKKKGKDT